MFALTLTGPKQLELLAAEEHEPLQEDEMLVQMAYSAVQPLDRDIASGEFEGFELPHVLGFDGVGTVVDSQCAAFPVSARVAFVSQIFGRVTSGVGGRRYG